MSNTPSDDVLFELIKEHFDLNKGPLDTVIDRKGRFYDAAHYRDFASAVLAKWGTPQPVMRESSEDLYWRLHGLSKILEGSGVIDESRNHDAYPTILDAMAFIREQQPVVREPLTPEQISSPASACHSAAA